MSLTPEQSAIIDETDRDIVVTAGAGSGKTHVLVERYVKLLERCRVDQLAAVTFTDAAAAEMRERVRRAVMDRPELAQHRSDIDDAIIGTIHSLCRRLLRENPVEAGLDPGVRVLADDQAEALVIQAGIDALEDAANAADARVLCLQEVGTWGLKQVLPQMVSRRDEVQRAFASMPGGAPAAWADGIKALLDAHCAALIEPLRTNVTKRVASARALFSGDPGDLLWTKASAAFQVLGDSSAGDALDFARRLRAAFGPLHLQGGSARNWSGDVPGARQLLRELREIAASTDDMPRWNEFDERAIASLASLKLVFDDACWRYRQSKSEEVAVDYLDLELEAHRLLSAHPEVAARNQVRFKHILVDELQDTNPIQIGLIRLLAGGVQRADSAPRLFLVGDIKQAIYRFRGSDVSHFAALCEEVGNAGSAHSLSKSFRAHGPLVTVFNDLFTSVFGEAKQPHEAPMEPMTGRDGDPPQQPHLTVAPVEQVKDQAATLTAAARMRRTEADLVASEIQAMLAEPRQVWDKTAHAYRPIRASDAALLLRRLTNVHIFEQALEARHVPYRTPAGAGFFTRQEVLDLTNLLGWLAEPDDDIALAGALRSPLFMIDDVTLLNLRDAGGNLLYALRALTDGLAPDIQERCVHAADVLEELRDLSLTRSADVVLERALGLTDFEASWAPVQGGEQAIANIRKLTGIARQLAGRSLDEVVDYLRARRDELAAREGLAVIEDSDAVRVMTAHGAKGLEFPIVFIPEADVDVRDTHEAVRWRASDGISLTLSPGADDDSGQRGRPGFYSYLVGLDRSEDVAEHKRLLYVAATRAGDAVFVSGKSNAGDTSWMGDILGAVGNGPIPGIDVRAPVLGDGQNILHQAGPPEVVPPSSEREEEYLPPLIAKPRVIPLRSSTPVTALRPTDTSHRFYGHGDKLGLVRGNLAHKAIERWFKEGARPDLASVLKAQVGTLGLEQIRSVLADVDDMLDRLASSPLAQVITDRSTEAHFELPFAWNWDGIAVHGTIDLAYRANSQWHVVDFKTDQVSGRQVAEAAAPYLPQLALYASALERATHIRPSAGLLFLRTGELFTADEHALQLALADTRNRLAAGGLIEVPAEGVEATLEAAL